MTRRLQHGVAAQVWTSVKYGPNHTMAEPFEHNRSHTFGHVYNRSAPLRTTLSTNFITCLGIARTVLSQLFAFLWRISKFGICINHSAASTMVARKINSRWRTSVFVCSQVQSSRPSTLCARRMDVNIASHGPCVKYVRKQSVA